MKISLKRLNQAGFDHMVVVVVFVVLFALVGTWFLIMSHAASSNFQLKMWLGDSKTNTGLCLDDYNSSKTGGTPIYAFSCNSGDGAQQWQLVSVSGGFQIKNPNTNICVDDKGGAVQKVAGAANRIPVITWSCNSADKAQIWTWSADGSYGMLRNPSNNGCINDPAGARSNTPLIVYTCSGAGKTTFQESAVAASGGGAAQGGSTSSAILAQAQKFKGFTYAPGGHESSGSAWHSACPTITNSNSGCHVDCSGLVNASVYLATGKWYDWIVSSGGYMTLGGSVDSTHWKAVSLSSAQPGDLVMASGHVEMVESGSGSWAKIRTFGAHGSGTPDGDQNIASYLNPIRLLHYNP